MPTARLAEVDITGRALGIASEPLIDCNLRAEVRDIPEDCKQPALCRLAKREGEEERKRIREKDGDRDRPRERERESRRGRQPRAPLRNRNRC